MWTKHLTAETACHHPLFLLFSLSLSLFSRGGGWGRGRIPTTQAWNHDSSPNQSQTWPRHPFFLPSIQCLSPNLSVLIHSPVVNPQNQTQSSRIFLKDCLLRTVGHHCNSILEKEKSAEDAARPFKTFF